MLLRILLLLRIPPLRVLLLRIARLLRVARLRVLLLRIARLLPVGLLRLLLRGGGLRVWLLAARTDKRSGHGQERDDSTSFHGPRLYNKVPSIAASIVGRAELGSFSAASPRPFDGVP